MKHCSTRIRLISGEKYVSIRMLRNRLDSV
jgi:hypothetical protein